MQTAKAASFIHICDEIKEVKIQHREKIVEFEGKAKLLYTCLEGDVVETLKNLVHDLKREESQATIQITQVNSFAKEIHAQLSHVIGGLGENPGWIENAGLLLQQLQNENEKCQAEITSITKNISKILRSITISLKKIYQYVEEKEKLSSKQEQRSIIFGSQSLDEEDTVASIAASLEPITFFQWLENQSDKLPQQWNEVSQLLQDLNCSFCKQHDFWEAAAAVLQQIQMETIEKLSLLQSDEFSPSVKKIFFTEAQMKILTSSLLSLVEGIVKILPD